MNAISARIPLLTLLAIAGGLTLDATLPGLGHTLANLLVSLCFVAVFALATPTERIRLAVCVALATAGEVFLCFGWNLYDYRYGNLPIFVPPGHAMIFLTGCRLAQHAPRATTRITLALVLPAAAALWILDLDRSVLFLLPILALCLIPRETRGLYSIMVLLALAVEIVGTRAGSWVWHPRMPGLGLSQWNPPLLAGVFYCGLDLLVLGSEKAASALRRYRVPAS